ncbi:hypothetical protein NLU13_0992 [Sarocladium strictum]|uniref:Glycine-rich domain-containing protein 1 n=1 Tax=Sarocladium strictum TaxID=5046 RepID=A0AA39GQC9_SARSR|nr:hypothetical protein NLU13_0992 [Sarocladium strictum]
MSFESPAHLASLHTLGREAVAGARLLEYPLARSINLSEALRPEEEAVIPSPSLFNFSISRGVNDGGGAESKHRPDEGTADKPSTGRRGSDSKDARREALERLPTVAECAAHLELLEVFYVLRQKVLVSREIDNALRIQPNRETKTGKKGDTKTLKDQTLWDRRQAKWDRYLEFACVRFLSWMDGLTPDDTVVTGDEPPLPKHLPPVDVLMVWHAFLLNPRLFHDRCGQRLIWKMRFPWEAIHAAIRSRDWSFELNLDDLVAYHKSTDLPPDLYKSFCQWDPPSVTSASYSWERRRRSDDEEGKVPLPLTRFSLAEAKHVGSVPLPLDSVTKRNLARYCQIFPRVDVPLALELKAAVSRQASFVDKMNAHLWIRSPAVEGTLRRAIERYAKFLAILARGKKFTIVPTLDVDLAWHTHQCFSGFGYAAAVKARVGRFINHDDTIAKETLGDGFDETRKLWRMYYGKEYRVCGCWDCEALLSGVEKASSAADLQAIATQVEADVLYHRIAESRLRSKRPLPKRRDL